MTFTVAAGTNGPVLRAEGVGSLSAPGGDGDPEQVWSRTRRLDVLETLPKGINYSGYIGHGALRTYVMGERAFDGAANDDEIEAMAREVQRAIRAGALGFSTSRSLAHETSDGRPVASRLAEWREIEAIVGAMGELNAGIFQLAAPREADPLYSTKLKDLAVGSPREVRRLLEPRVLVLADQLQPRRELRRHGRGRLGGLRPRLDVSSARDQCSGGLVAVRWEAGPPPPTAFAYRFDCVMSPVCCCASAAATDPSESTFAAMAAFTGIATFALISDIAARSGRCSPATSSSSSRVSG